MAEPRRSKSDFAPRGDSLYETEVEPRLAPEDTGKFVAIDIDSGAFEIARDELSASDRLLARRPDAQVWLRRVGSRHTHRVVPRTSFVAG